MKNDWLNSFQGDFQKLIDWYNTSPRDRSLLYYALKSGEVDSAHYVTWAREHFQLPSLSENFFDTEIPLHLWTKHWHLKWSEELVPVGEWDDLLLVALQTPLEEPPPGVIMILAPIECTEIWFRTFEVLGQRPVDSEADPFFLEMQSEKPSMAMDDKTQAIDTDTGDRTQSSPYENASTQTQNLQKVALSKVQEESFNRHPELLKLDEITENSTHEEPEESQEDSEWPEGLGKNPVEPSKNLLNQLHSSSYNPDPEVFVEEISPEDNEGPDGIKIPPNEKHDTKSNGKGPLHKTEIEIHFPSDNLKISDESVLQIMWKNHRPRIEPLIQNAFKDLKSTYKQLMILQVEGTQLTPWIWDNSFSPPAQLQKIPLLENSVFKIVYKTLKSYHGYVVNNSINQIFFKDWTNNKVPSHLTLVPLVHNEHLIGVLLGIAEHDIALKPSLQLAEKVGYQISSTLTSLSSHRKPA